MKKIIISAILMSLASSQVTFADTNSVPQTSTTSSSYSYVLVPEEINLMLLNPSPHSVETKVSIRTLMGKNAGKIDMRNYAKSLRSWSENESLTIENVKSYLFFEAQIAKSKAWVLVGINKDRNKKVATSFADLNFDKILSGKEALKQSGQNELIIFWKNNDDKSDNSKPLYATLEDLGELAKTGFDFEETTHKSYNPQKRNNPALRRLTFSIPQLGLFTLIFRNEIDYYKTLNSEQYNKSFKGKDIDTKLDEIFRYEIDYKNPNSEQYNKRFKWKDIDTKLDEIFSDYTTILTVESVFTHIQDKK
jgi:hypothetical protein